jgi:hypothetical protein|tara:strand:+ start:248 stop:1000 length:753 start_codon:yes stop_codon:yes gene_type:complete
MILLCNGDSWTQGDSPAQKYDWESRPNLDWYNIIPDFGEPTCPTDDKLTYKFYDSDVWPKVLGKKLGLETWNCGRNGASNDRIFRSTINSVEYLESLGKKDLFVVIGLTSLTRFSNLEKQNDRLVYNDVHLWHDLMKNITNLDVVYHKHLVNIINLQNYLKMKNIPYLIFNAFDKEMESDLTKHKLYDNIDLNNIYNKDFKPHFLDYIEKKFNTNWGNNDDYFIKSHPTDKSHIEWANNLHKYIKENYNV